MPQSNASAPAKNDQIVKLIYTHRPNWSETFGAVADSTGYNGILYVEHSIRNDAMHKNFRRPCRDLDLDLAEANDVCRSPKVTTKHLKAISCHVPRQTKYTRFIGSQKSYDGVRPPRLGVKYLMVDTMYTRSSPFSEHRPTAVKITIDRRLIAYPAFMRRRAAPPKNACRAD